MQRQERRLQQKMQTSREKNKETQSLAGNLEKKR
jgi:hypothetical protein